MQPRHKPTHAAPPRQATQHATRLGVADVRRELPQLWRLAWPVIFGELGWHAMGLVDTLVVGRVSPEALGGVSIGGSIFFVAAVFGLGLLLGLDFCIARAIGAGRSAEAGDYLRHGLLLAAVTSLVQMLVLWRVVPWLPHMGIDPAVVVHATPYLEVVAWSCPPLLLFAALRRFLQAVGAVRVIALAIVFGNIVNAVADWMFVLGNWGAPALGAAGAAWATVFSRVLLAACLLAYVWRQHGDVLWVPTRLRLAPVLELVRLGLPAAGQLVLEVGVFSLVTTLAGRLGAHALAAHHIVLSIASLTFMVPLAISSSAAVRVGHAVGAGDGRRTALAGWTAILLAGGLMAICSVAFVLIPELLVRLFTADGAVVATGVGLLWIAALFQLFDGIQVAATGCLRGVGDTRTPLLGNLVAHWAIGLPLGAALCFQFGWGVHGLWVGLSVGLIVVAVALLLVWRRRANDCLRTEVLDPSDRSEPSEV